VQGPILREVDLFRRLLDHVNDAVYFVDRARHIVYWNESAERLTGFSRLEVIGRRCSDGLLDHIDDQGRQLCDRGCPLLRAVSEKETRQERVFLRHKDGRRISVYARTLPVQDDAGNVVGAAQVFSDATSMLVVESAYRQVREAADRDPLTGAANRRYFDRSLAQYLEDLGRSEKPLSLIMADLDHFKQVNDALGHAAGDAALVRFAATLQGQCRPFDLVTRYGGEEFIVLLPDLSVETAAHVAERLRRATPDATPVEAGDWRLTASFGVAQAAPGESAADLLKRLDSALYRAKAQGRDRVEIEPS
jgi:diguanylate cyclase (GGDEF)-like protein/PAS domain S-box-containing protein